MAYSFQKSKDLFNTYIFETKSNVFYSLKFKHSPFMLGDNKKEFSESIFEFVIEVFFNPEDKLPAKDDLISETIHQILLDFFQSKNETTCLYICDSSNGKQLVRRRKFNQWFDYFVKSNFVKYDEILFDKNDNEFPFSLIMQKHNKYIPEVIAAFQEIINSFTSMIVQNDENKLKTLESLYLRGKFKQHNYN